LTRSAHPTELFDESLFAGIGRQPHCATDRIDEFGEIYSAIDTLPPLQRESILLYYLDDYDIKEISESLNLPSSTIKNRLCVARKQLRKDLWFMDTSITSEQKESSREREIRRSILLRILDDFKQQLKRDPITADRGLLDQGKTALLDLLKKDKDLTSEEIRGGFYFLSLKFDKKTLSAVLARYLSQDISDSETAWAYYQLILAISDAADTLLAYESFEKWLPGKKFRLAWEWPHYPLADNSDEDAWTENNFQMLCLSMTRYCYKDIWRSRDYFNKVDDILKLTPATEEDAARRFELLRYSVDAAVDVDDFEHADSYLTQMNELADLTKYKDQQILLRHQCLEQAITIAMGKKNEKDAFEIAMQYLKLIEDEKKDEKNLKYVQIARHNIGFYLMRIKRHDLALSLWKTSESEGVLHGFGGCSHFFYAATLWQVTKDRENTLALLRRAHTLREDPSFRKSFLEYSEFADVRGDSEFLEAVGE
jgi:predicted DNA-binding protein YlxM (UPF0122 family)